MSFLLDRIEDRGVRWVCYETGSDNIDLTANERSYYFTIKAWQAEEAETVILQHSYKEMLLE
jgi:hypothetical protein